MTFKTDFQFRFFALAFGLAVTSGAYAETLTEVSAACPHGARHGEYIVTVRGGLVSPLSPSYVKNSDESKLRRLGLRRRDGDFEHIKERTYFVDSASGT